MFEWLFKKKNNNLEDLAKILKNGININVQISGNINVKEERRDSLGEMSEKYRINTFTNEIKQTTERTKEEDIGDSIPNFAKLGKPQVNFGEEKEA